MTDHKGKSRAQLVAERILFEGERYSEPAFNQPGMVKYGIFDRPVRSETTVPSEEPIEADPGISVNGLLQDQLPPIEDEDYEPANSRELAWALYAMGLEIPDDKVSAVYKSTRDSYRDSSSVEESSDKVEEVIKRIFEAEELPYVEDEEDFERQFQRGAGYREVPQSEVPWVEPDLDSPTSYEDMAKVFGYSGVTGVRQWIERVLNKIANIVSSMAGGKLDVMLEEATKTFIEQLEIHKVIDGEDKEYMLANPEAVQDLPSFKYWLNNAYYLPAYKALENEQHDKIRTAMDKAGIPAELDVTIIGQVTGGTKRKDSVVFRRLTKKMGMEEEEAKKMTEKIGKFIDKQKLKQEEPTQFLDLALKSFNDMDKGKKKRALKKSIDQVFDTP